MSTQFIWVMVCSSQLSTIPVTHCTKRSQPGRVKTAVKGLNNDSHHVHNWGAWSMTLPPFTASVFHLS